MDKLTSLLHVIFILSAIMSIIFGTQGAIKTNREYRLASIVIAVTGVAVMWLEARYVLHLI